MPLGKPVKRLLLAVLLLWLAASAAVAWLMATEQGLKTAIGIAQRYVDLSIESAEGRLVGPLRLDGLVYRSDTVELATGQVIVEWTPRALLGMTLQLDRLHLDGVSIQLPKSAARPAHPPEAIPFAMPVLPIGIEVRDVSVTDLTLLRPATAPLLIEQISLAARADTTGLDLERLEIVAPDLGLQASGGLAAAGPGTVSIDIEWYSHLSEFPSVNGEGKITGSLDNLYVVQTLEQDVRADLALRLRNATTAPGWELTLDLHSLGDHPLLAAAAAMRPSGHLEAAGDLENLRAELDLVATLPEVGLSALNLQVEGGLEQLDIKQLVLQLSEAGGTLQAQGRFAPQTASIDLDGNWQQLTWPVGGPPQVSSSAGTFTLHANRSAYQLALEAALALPDLASITTAMTLHGDLESLSVDSLKLALDQSPARLEGSAHMTFAGLGIEARGGWRSLQWPLKEAAQYQSEAGTWSFDGTPDAYRMALDGSLDSADTGPLQIGLRGHGDPQEITLDALNVKTDDGRALQLSANGRYRLDGSDLALNANWQGLQWPAVGGHASVTSDRGTATLTGNLNDYKLALNAGIASPGLPASSWQASATGNLQGLRIDALHGELLEGLIEGQGQVAWQPAPSWNAQLTAEQINPGMQWPAWPGKIALALNSSGTLGADGIHATVDLGRLRGELIGEPLSGHGRAAVDGSVISIDALELTFGGAEASITGRLAEQVDATFRLQAPDLAKLLPGTAGSVTAEGSVAGPMTRPQIALVAHARALRYGETRIDTLQADAKLDLTPGSASTLSLSVSDLAAAGRQWSKLLIQGSGTPEQHRITAEATGDVALALRLDGGWDGAQWQGTLADTAVDTAQSGAWLQRETARLTAAPDHAGISALCLGSDNARLCLDGGWQASSGTEVRGSLTAWPADRLSAWIPPALRIDGSVDAGFDLRLPVGGRPAGQLQAELIDGMLHLGETDAPINIEILKLALLGTIEARTGHLTADLDLGDHGAARADIALSGLATQPTLNGTITADYHEQGLLTALVPALQDVQADLHADLKLSGPVWSPAVQGELDLSSATAEIPAAGIRLESDAITLRGSENGLLLLEGSLRSGESTLRITGELTPAPLAFSLAARGDAFTAVNTPEIRAVVSPDLNISMEGQLLKVRGEVVLPELKLEPRSTSATTARSSDVVIVDAPEPASPPLQIDAKVRVTLGDEVRIKVPGFEAHLAGSIEVEQQPGRAALATGSVELDSGNYKIFGQKLEITRGRVLYAGGPVGDPGLDLEAVRKVDEVTAGVRIGGRLAAPDVKLFSIPAHPDNVVLSYLLFGRPPDARSGDEGAMLSQAAMALGMNSGNKLTGSLRQSAGLDVLKFEGGATKEETTLVVGKYLSPELYISYGLGLFEPVNRFLVRYELTPSLSVESSTSGTTSGTDLIYTIER